MEMGLGINLACFSRGVCRYIIPQYSTIYSSNISRTMVLAYQVNSKYRLRIAEYPEVEEISRVSVRAFASQPFIREIFPYGDKYPEEELRSRIYTTRQRFLKDNYIVWVVEDTEAKRITGFSIWAKLNGDKPVNPNYGFLTRMNLNYILNMFMKI